MPVPAADVSLKLLCLECSRGLGDGGRCWGWERKGVRGSLQVDFQRVVGLMFDWEVLKRLCWSGCCRELKLVLRLRCSARS